MWMTDKAFPWNPFITLRQKFLGASRSLSWLKLQISNLNSHLHFAIVFFFGCYGRQGHRWYQTSLGLQSNLNLYLYFNVVKVFDTSLFRAWRKLGKRSALTPAKKKINLKVLWWNGAGSNKSPKILFPIFFILFDSPLEASQLHRSFSTS